MTPSPAEKLQRVVVELITRLHAFTTEHTLGRVFTAPFDVLLAEGD